MFANHVYKHSELQTLNLTAIQILTQKRCEYLLIFSPLPGFELERPDPGTDDIPMCQQLTFLT